MTRFIGRRLASMILVLLGASIFSFALAEIAPGDVTTTLLGPYATPQARAELRQQLALNEPIPVQYIHWLGRAVTGDLGESVELHEPVVDVIAQKFPNTLLLASASFVIALVFGLGAGLLSALRYGGASDRGVQAAVGFFAYMPVFWLGVMLVYVFSLKLHWLPSSGMGPVAGGGNAVTNVQYLVLPALATAGIPAAIIARSARSAFHTQLSADYIRTARSKGLSRAMILRRHLSRAAMPSVLHVAGLQFAYLLAGSIVFTEVVFNWPGIGYQVYSAVTARDVPVIQGVVLLAALITVLINLAVDVIHALLDPRTLEPSR